MGPLMINMAFMPLYMWEMWDVTPVTHEHTDEQWKVVQYSVWAESAKTVVFILFFCILLLLVRLEQIYLERQLTLKEILPLEEVCLCFVYSPAWILHCCLVHKGPCIIWTRMIWYDLSLSTAPATFVGRWKVLRGHKVGHGVLWDCLLYTSPSPRD